MDAAVVAPQLRWKTTACQRPSGETTSLRTELSQADREVVAVTLTAIATSATTTAAANQTLTLRGIVIESDAHLTPKLTCKRTK